MGRACSMRKEKRNAYGNLVGKPEGKRQRHRWEDNIRNDLRETVWGFVRTGVIRARLKTSGRLHSMLRNC
jgi:hypothetical protein